MALIRSHLDPRQGPDVLRWDSMDAEVIGCSWNRMWLPGPAQMPWSSDAVGDLVVRTGRAEEARGRCERIADLVPGHVEV